MRLEETLDSMIFLKTVTIFLRQLTWPNLNSKLSFPWVGNSWNLSLVLLAAAGLLGTCSIHASVREIWAEFTLRIWGYCGVPLFWGVSPYFPAVVTWTLSSNSSVGVKISTQMVATTYNLTWACPWVRSCRNTDVTCCRFFLSSVDSQLLSARYWTALAPPSRVSVCACAGFTMGTCERGGHERAALPRLKAEPFWLVVLLIKRTSEPPLPILLLSTQ